MGGIPTPPSRRRLVSQSATPTISCFSPLAVPIEARFDGPQLTSDGGLVWLAEADATLGLCAALGSHLREWRTGPVRHSLETLVRQRIFQIACGYEDQDDADTLRSDPLLKLVCGRVPNDPDLASQPTLSRLENTVDGLIADFPRNTSVPPALVLPLGGYGPGRAAPSPARGCPRLRARCRPGRCTAPGPPRRDWCCPRRSRERTRGDRVRAVRALLDGSRFHFQADLDSLQMYGPMQHSARFKPPKPSSVSRSIWTS
jgi:Transposase DDE domain group 1